ncbi:MAG TPA: SDR family NAD(P)-dependent oxidoreductase [Verrucomicrobiae bacterium]|jgi:NAD(P)-dependent dehydrogenase (short-subunit alcohol dehydrogenase family)|nr:SDR family NAD(P)-dependent oxidoreductase [Verrucomicrobiae bacterium]
MASPAARRFEGKVVLITGAAGGIGRAAAVRFAAEGARLGLVDLSRDGLRETQAAVEKAGGVGHAVGRRSSTTRASWATYGRSWTTRRRPSTGCSRST